MASTSRAAARTSDSAAARAMADEAAHPEVYEQRVPTWPVRVASVVIGLLWLTQILWKLPWNNFVNPGEAVNGMMANPTITADQPGPFIDNGNGLYHWMTQEAIHGLIGYGGVVKALILPNWQLIGWLTFFMETAIALLLLLGLLSRLGGLLGLLQGINLFLGLGFAPGEWYWSYGMLIILSFLFLFTGAGRVWGVDQWLRPKLREQIAAGNGLAGLLYRLT